MSLFLIRTERFFTLPLTGKEKKSPARVKKCFPVILSVGKGQHLTHNLKKLESVTDSDWVVALKKCRDHVKIRLRKRTLFGAHTDERLGMDPVDYYVGFAYDSIIEGNWEWKSGRDLGKQLVRIAENRIGKEVEKFKIEHDVKFSTPGDMIDEHSPGENFYSQEPPPVNPSIVQEAVYGKKIAIIEEAVRGDENLEMFWECVKDGMKRDEIATFMEKQPKQVDKFREKLINKIKNSAHFELG